jgi:hypothetical protein
MAIHLHISQMLRICGALLPRPIDFTVRCLGTRRTPRLYAFFAQSAYIERTIGRSCVSIWRSHVSSPELSNGIRLNLVLVVYSIRCRDGFVFVGIGSRVRFPAGAGNFSLYHRVQNGTGTHPASYPVVPGALSLGVKRPGCEADHSPPSSAEVKE